MRRLLLAILILGVPSPLRAWVLVGNLTNPPSLELPIRCCNHRCVPGLGGGCPDTGFGSVDHSFEIQPANVTVSEYLVFLNAVAADDPHQLYVNSMSDWIVRTPPYPNSTYALADPALAERPMVRVDFFSMLRYANWMHNDRPSGAAGPATTEDGAYTLLGQNPPWVQRNPGARYFLPDEDEWYKASFYEPGSGSYSRFSWGEALPRGLPPEFASGPEDANLCAPPGSPNPGCSCTLNQGPAASTDVCAYPGRSAYGLCDTTGNLFDVLETREVSSGDTGAPPAGTVMPVIRGGAFGTPGFCDSAADGRNFLELGSRCSWCGFRLARQPLAVPAPPAPALTLAMLGALRGLTTLRRRSPRDGSPPGASPA